MSINRKYKWLATTATVAFILAACNGDSGTEDPADPDDPTEDPADPADPSDPDASSDEEITFETSFEKDGEHVEGSTLEVALVSDAAFPGIFSPAFSEINTDGTVQSYMRGSFFHQDDTFMYTDQGAAWYEVDEDNDLVTMYMRDDVFWHDGEQVTLDDYVFAYEIIGHPDYTGVRYQASGMGQILGMEEYNNGEADEIEGFTLSEDELELEIQFVEGGINITVLQAGGQLWSAPEPRHQLGDVPVAEMAESPEVRQNPIGFGPFKVETIEDGDGVVYSRFDDYFRGTPYIEEVVLERVPTGQAVAAMENATYDIYHGAPISEFESWYDLPGHTYLGDTQHSYDYIGFNLGYWDHEEGHVVTDPDMKMADKSLRQAMAYAIDNDAVGQYFYEGLRTEANSPIVPTFGEYYNEDMEGTYAFDQDAANALLDDAGYEYDGEYRTTPEGEELTINLASRANSGVAEAVNEFYIQLWGQVGLNVQLLEGRLHEANSFYDRIDADDEAIDIFWGGWSMGSDPTPSGIYGRDAFFNFSRWATEEHDQFLADMISEDAWDLEWRYGVFHDYQEYFMEELPVMPTMWSIAVSPYNNRVSRANVEVGTDPDEWGLHQLRLLADSPVSGDLD